MFEPWWLGGWKLIRNVVTKGQLITAAFLGFSASLVAQPSLAAELQMLDLGTLSGGSFNTQAKKINDKSEIAGDALTPDGYRHGFVWKMWTMQDLGTLGGRECYVSDINNLSQITGTSNTASGARHAFLWHDGKMMDIGTLGRDFTEALSMNDFGQIVGYSSPTGGTWNSFRWENGAMTDSGISQSFGVDINDLGQAVGYRSNSVNGVTAFLWGKNTSSDLPTLGGDFTWARAINNSDQVIGTGTIFPAPSEDKRAFLWEGGTLTVLGTLGGNESSAYAINKTGQIIGTSLNATGETHAFVWRNGLMIDLGTLGGTYSSPAAINDAGQIVGISETTTGDYHAFLWQNNLMTDLGTLGGSYSEAFSINNAGQIVGVSNNIDNTEAHAVLWATINPSELIDVLYSKLSSYNLTNSFLNKLLNKVDDAKKFLNSGDYAKVCTSLIAFTNEVNAQNGKLLSAIKAKELALLESNIVNIIHCK